MADNGPNVILHKEPITDDVENALIDRIFSNAKLMLDLGAGHRRNARLGSFKDRLKCPSFCMDLRFSTTIDVNGNLENLPFKDNSVHTAVCWSVLEHVHEPQRCVESIHRVLGSGGLLLVQLPFLYPLHGTKDEVDCYRFTLFGVQYLFRQFSRVEIFSKGDYADVLAWLMVNFNKGTLAGLTQTILARVFRILLALFGKRLNPWHNNTGWVIVAYK